MNLRAKLFLLLAAVALIPLVLLGVLENRETIRLGRQLSDANRTEIATGVTGLLNRAVRSSSAYLDRLTDVCALSAELQATAVEQALRRGEALHAPSIAASARSLYRTHPDLFVNVLSAIGGDTLVEPARRPFPTAFDPRTRPWYQVGIRAATAAWSPAFISASTGTLTMAVAAPIHAPDGTVVGTAAIELGIVDLLREIDRTTFDDASSGAGGFAGLSGSVRSLLVAPRGGGTTALGVLADRSYEGGRADWRVFPQALSLDAGGAAYPALGRDVAAGRAGVARISYRGSDSIVAYAPVAALHAALLVTLPYDRILAAADAESLPYRARAATEVRTTIAIAVAIVVLVALVALLVSGPATRSIRTLVAVAGRIGAGDLRARAPVRGHDEIAALAEAINAMVPKLEDGIQMRATLELARTVQQNLLPARPVTVAGFDVAGMSRYCDEMGGDYYDIIDLSRDGRPCIGVAIGDVSGHGVAAAFLMAAARAALRVSLEAGATPLEAVRRVNTLLCSDLNDGSFITLLLLVIDEDGTLRWVNAGHDAPLAYQLDRAAFVALEGGDVPLGIEPAWEYAERSCRLPAGELVVVVGTDGIWETTDPAGRPYGRERYRELVRRLAPRPAVQLAAGILQDVVRYREGAPPADDVTLVAVRFAPSAVPVGRAPAQGTQAPVS